ncbi:microfibril-associated glycoprotein 4-like [Pollicipes pollicipes]|uniref:microfibril-associated glycoprotein 4-like n=1 Tax=Pollicipes pollicipes TaxID=41117 RepID=UPI00188531F6|nr:microfibril-associated glycoprotein 4-like [Pollicipes pollicipes]
MSLLRIGATICLVLWIPAPCDGVCNKHAEQIAGLNRTRLREVVSVVMELTCRPMLADLKAQLERLQLQRAVLGVPTGEPPPRDCSDLPTGTTSGVHLVWPGLQHPVPVYCDLDKDGGGWTVFQRRADIKPRQNFYLSWDAYKWGFGRFDGEFWWGNEYLWRMTSLMDRRYELRVNMEDFDGVKRYATYWKFKIRSEAVNYRLQVGGYAGNAGDSLTRHCGRPFTTWDRNNEKTKTNFAQKYKGAWWYHHGHYSNLNGLYLAGPHPRSYANGINWRTFRGFRYSLKYVEMKIRPFKS